jgi:hypothetical protein
MVWQEQQQLSTDIDSWLNRQEAEENLDCSHRRDCKCKPVHAGPHRSDRMCPLTVKSAGVETFLEQVSLGQYPLTVVQGNAPEKLKKAKSDRPRSLCNRRLLSNPIVVNLQLTRVKDAVEAADGGRPLLPRGETRNPSHYMHSFTVYFYLGPEEMEANHPRSQSVRRFPEATLNAPVEPQDVRHFSFSEAPSSRSSVSLTSKVGKRVPAPATGRASPSMSPGRPAEVQGSHLQRTLSLDSERSKVNHCLRKLLFQFPGRHGCG